MGEINLEAKATLNANDLIKTYWPVMTFPLIVIMVIGYGAYLIASQLSGERYMIITYWIFVIPSLILYGVATFLFYNDVKKAIVDSRLSKDL